MMVLQVELTREATKRVAWIDKNLNVGDVVTLKNDKEFGPKCLWEVTAVYQSTDLMSINRHWNNNI